MHFPTEIAIQEINGLWQRFMRILRLAVANQKQKGGNAMRMHLILPIVMWMVITVNTSGIMARSDCPETVPQLFKQISPSVVFIAAVSFDPLKPRDRVTTSVGSGFVIKTDGLILTNSHLVSGHQSINVTLDDGQMVQAELVGVDC